LGAIVNRDLSRRIRTVSGLTNDKKVVRNDIRLATKVITNLDKKWRVWTSQEDEEAQKVNLTSTTSFSSLRDCRANLKVRP
jgi:hypothetical protein